MSDKIAEAQAAKARGNAAFSSGDFETAVKEFTAAIDLNPDDHVFYSNRSGAYASMKKYEEALADAEKCISVKPDWAKGYSRKGLAALQLKNFALATESYSKGLEVDPNNAQCQQGLKDVESAEKAKANPMASLFGDAMWGKLQSDPVTREYLKDPNFVQKMKMLQQNPNMMGSALGSDPQMSAALGVILGLGSAGFQTMNPNSPDFDMGGAADEPMPEAPKDSAAKMDTTADTKVEEEEEEEEDVELAAEKKLREEAIAEKNKGNAFYKKREFEEALACYEKAIEKDPENISFQTNKAAVYFEMKDYDKCISICEDAVKEATSRKGYDYMVVAKAWSRIGNAQEKKGELTEALESQRKALLEHPLPAATAAVKKLEKKIKEAAEKAYLSKDKAEEHKAKGNEFFQEQKWKEAIDEYTESLRRDPTNFKVYSNRAACYTKLMDWQRGLDDCDKCLELDSTFVKAYIRKGKIQHFLKQYHKAIETFQKGLDIDPTASELIEGKRQTMAAINNENSSGNVDPNRAKEAMKDPEIQQILADPMINKVLKDMQTDPANGQKALQDPAIMSKIEKLIAAGVLQVGSR